MVEESWENFSERQQKEELRARFREETNPSRSALHKFFALISVCTGLSAFNMGVGQLVGLMVAHSTDSIQYFLRMYVIALCLLVILIEKEWTSFARDSMILHNWITRGLVYGFIGLLGLEENDRAAWNRGSSWSDFNLAERYVSAVAWVMVGFGFVYFGMGICCLQLVYNRLRKDYQERRKRAPDIQRAAETYGVGADMQTV